ncbi:MAG: YicC family protein [Alphaproteobacteria bacterium RIFCSPHIGHO2_12_FULL_63_12]|nr:MAG: YicC family protein [Alphaproteobacteria bacterium RIFCSPHIGHO2_12_FULL_63_12]
MALSSMTGFARVDGALGETRWVWEMKSVNGRGLEPRFRLPPGYDFLEHDLRKLLADKFSRGSFNVFLLLKGAAIEGSFAVNRAALASALKLIEEIRLAVDCDKPRPEGVLALRGVIEQESALDDEDARAALAGALKESFREAADALLAARRKEGALLDALILGQLGAIESLTNAARASAEAATGAIRAKIAAQLADLLAGAVPAERLAEEAAMLAVKADIREELDRLDAHVAAGRALISEGGPAGRKLDFLTQEFNREANTLCSKAQDMGLKRIGLDLKTTIDQMREQVQNLE